MFLHFLKKILHWNSTEMQCIHCCCDPWDRSHSNAMTEAPSNTFHIFMIHLMKNVISFYGRRVKKTNYMEHSKCFNSHQWFFKLNWKVFGFLFFFNSKSNDGWTQWQSSLSSSKQPKPNPHILDKYVIVCHCFRLKALLIILMLSLTMY